MDKCKCGAEALTKEHWACGTRINELQPGYHIHTRDCLERQARRVMAITESLAEFHRGVACAYHRWSTGEIDATEYVTETAQLLIVIPGED